MSGLSASGFERKRLVDIKIDIEDNLKLAFGDNIDLSAQSGFGQFVGIMSEALSDQWESQENVYNSQYPSTAQGTQLSNVVMYNGIERQEATKSVILAVTLSGIAGTVIPAGSQVSVVSTEEVFVTDTEATIGVGGTTTVNVTAVNTGPVAAAIGTLTVIETPVYGWTSVNNTAAATEGRDEETDAELRVRRELSTAALGQNLVDALYGQLLNLEGVTDALVISNGTDGTVDGIPAHQFLTVVIGGTDANIAATIWRNTPQGILSFGTTTVVHVDDQGFSQNVKFTRPSEVDIYFKVNITTNSVEFPATGSNDIKAAIVAYGIANFKIGDDVILSEFYTPINATPGILTIVLYIGLSASPSGTSNLTIDNDEVSDYAISQVEVNIT
jgi:uncharacterized phage protein gp47/JayE